jgi:hypothetical protein
MLEWHRESGHLSDERQNNACDRHDVGVVFEDVPCPASWALLVFALDW